MDLTQKKCVPCEGGVDPLKRDKIDIYQTYLPEPWEVVKNDKEITKTFTFKNFKAALDFINKAGEIAESEGHHPNLYLHDYKNVKVELSTHAIQGLSENDFIVASKIESLLQS